MDELEKLKQQNQWYKDKLAEQMQIHYKLLEERKLSHVLQLPISSNWIPLVKYPIKTINKLIRILISAVICILPKKD